MDLKNRRSLYQLHDLKNMLAALEGNFSLLKTQGNRSKARQETEKIIFSLIPKICKSIEAFLQNQSKESQHSEQNLSDTLEKMTTYWQKFSRHRDLGWNISIQSNIKISADRLRLQSLCHNILSNAVQYSPAESSISVSLKKAGRKCHLVLTNPVKEKPNNSIGSGLIFTAEIVRNLQGTLKIEQKKDLYQIIITLPIL